jgi:hypothetical protein
MQSNHPTNSWQSEMQSPGVGRRVALFLGLAAVGSACIVVSMYAAPGQATQKPVAPTTSVSLPEPVVVTPPETPSQKWIARPPAASSRAPARSASDRASPAASSTWRLPPTTASTKARSSSASTTRKPAPV